MDEIGEWPSVTTGTTHGTSGPGINEWPCPPIEGDLSQMTIEGRFLSGNFQICAVPKKEYCDRCTDSSFWHEAKANTKSLKGYVVNLCPECEAKFKPFTATYRAEFDARMKAQWSLWERNRTYQIAEKYILYLPALILVASIVIWMWLNVL